jgi:hypothetical protein
MYEGTGELNLPPFESKKSQKNQDPDSKPKNTVKRQKAQSAISLKKISYPFVVDEEFTIHSLGEIVLNNPMYYSENCIYPKNYMVSRNFISLNNPNEKIVYTLRILDNLRDGYPQFQIIPEGDYDQVIVGQTSDYCHTELLQQIYKHHDQSIIIKPNGDNFFGLTNPKIKSLIYQLPNADKLLKLFQSAKRENLLIDDHSSMNYVMSTSYPFQEEVKTEIPESMSFLM